MSFISDQQLTGRIICFVGLALAPLCTIFARHYSRTLYFTQFLSILSVLMAMSGSASSIISNHLDYSLLQFMSEFTSNYCTAGDFSCTNGKLLSPAIVWLAVSVLFFIIIKIVACKKRQAKYLSFYNFHKGFMYWFFGPLVYASVYTVAPLIDVGTTSSNDFYAGVIVLIVFVAIALAELIAYKVAQREEQNIWRKWIQFSSHIMVSGTVSLMAIYLSFPGTQDTLKYLIPNLFLGLFALLYLIQYKFTAKVVERIAMIIQDGIIIATLNIFIFKYSYIVDNHLDFYALLIVAIIEIIEVFIKFIIFCRNKDGGEDDAVAPEKEDRETRGRVNNSFGAGLNPEGSYDGLNNSQVRGGGYASPPRRGAPRRR